MCSEFIYTPSVDEHYYLKASLKNNRNLGAMNFLLLPCVYANVLTI